MTFIDSGILASLNTFTPRSLNPFAWYDVHLAGTPGQTVADQMGGTAATLGSAAGVDTNDPQWLQWSGADFAYLPGAASNYISTPDTATISIVGDLEGWVYVAADLWVPATQMRLLSKWTTTGNQRSFSFSLFTDGKLRLETSAAGTASTVTANSSVAPTVADGAGLWVGFTMTVNNGSAGNDVKFWTSTNAVGSPPTSASGGTQLGTTVTTAGTTSVFDSTAVLEIGTDTAGATLPFTGKVYRGQLRSGLAGTLVSDFDASKFTAGSSTTYTDAVGTNAGVWTINRSTAGRKVALVKGRSMLLLGTDDYLQLPIGATPPMLAASAFSVFISGRQWATPTAYGRWFDNETGGVSLLNSNTNNTLYGNLHDATTSFDMPGQTFTFGQKVVAGLVINGQSATGALVYLNTNTATTTDTTTAGDRSSTFPFRVGMVAQGGGFQDLEFDSIVIFNRALTSAEVSALVTYYQGGT